MFVRLSVLLLLHLFIVCACGKKAPVDVCQLRTNVEDDPTVSWLLTTREFGTPRYYETFDRFYDNQIRERSYRLAGEALEAVASQEAFHFSFTDDVLSKVQEFREKYARGFGPGETLFIANYFGNYYSDQGDFNRSLPYFRSILRHQPKNAEECSATAGAYYDLGFAYSSLGQQEKALKHNLAAIHYYKRLKDTSGIAGSFTNLGLVHLFSKNYRRAEEDFDRALRDYTAIRDTANVLTTLHNKILLYEELDKPERFALIDSAHRLLQSYVNRDISTTISIETYYVNKLLHDGNYKKAAEILDKVKILTGQIESPFSTSEYEVALAEYQIAAGIEVDAALLEAALAAVEEVENYQVQLNFLSVLKDDAVRRKDFRRAFTFSEKEKNASQKLSQRTIIVKTLELNKKLESGRKEQQIALQKKSLENKSTTIALLFMGLIVLALGLAVYLSVLRLRKSRIEKLRSIRFTRQLLEKTEDERKRIAGDLHDSVSHELLTLKGLVGQDNPGNRKIDSIISDIRVISRNLHPIMFEKVGLQASVEQLAERSQSAHNLMISTEIDYTAGLSVPDELQIYRIIQEALSNTIKYAGAIAARITIETYIEYVLIEVKDNGKGFNLEETLAGNKAFGILNIIERANAIGGHARISSDNHGTTITITINR